MENDACVHLKIKRGQWCTVYNARDGAISSYWCLLPGGPMGGWLRTTGLDDQRGILRLFGSDYALQNLCRDAGACHLVQCPSCSRHAQHWSHKTTHPGAPYNDSFLESPANHWIESLPQDSRLAAIPLARRHGAPRLPVRARRPATAETFGRAPGPLRQSVPSGVALTHADWLRRQLAPRARWDWLRRGLGGCYGPVFAFLVGRRKSSARWSLEHVRIAPSAVWSASK
jgi:hypothetical protein